MAVKQVKNVADIPSDELEDWGAVPQPISETVSHLRGRIINENPDGSKSVPNFQARLDLEQSKTERDDCRV